MEYGLLALIAAVIAGGVSGALLRVWSIASRLYSQETRLSVLEGVSSREVKIRAANERWKKPSAAEDAVLAALANPPAPSSPANWWQNPNLKKGAYVP